MIEEIYLQALPPNTSYLYETKIKDGEETIVRTGTIECSSEVDSFLHAVLLGYSREYFDLDEIDKTNFVRKFKKHFTEKNKDNLLNTGLNALEEIYHFIYNYTNPSKVNITNKVASKVICEIISKDIKFYSLLLTDIAPKEKIMKMYSTNIESMSLKITNYIYMLDVLSKVDRKKIASITDKFLHLLTTVVSLVKEFYSEVEIEQSVSNPIFLSTLCKKIGRNIYFIDSDTSFPYRTTEEEVDMPYERSIVVLKINKKFETLGKLYERNRVRRDLANDELFIENIQKYLRGEFVVEEEEPEPPLVEEEPPVEEAESEEELPELVTTEELSLEELEEPVEDNGLQE